MDLRKKLLFFNIKQWNKRSQNFRNYENDTVININKPHAAEHLYNTFRVQTYKRLFAVRRDCITQNSFGVVNSCVEHNRDFRIHHDIEGYNTSEQSLPFPTVPTLISLPTFSAVHVSLHVSTACNDGQPSRKLHEPEELHQCTDPRNSEHGKHDDVSRTCTTCGR